MDYKLNLATLKITINSAKPDSDKETIKKLENIINNQKERLRLIINNTNKTECVLNSLLYSSHPDKIKEIKIFNSCPAYRSLLLILFKLNLDLLSIESMSPMPFVLLMYSLSREKSKIFKNEEFMEVFGHYGDFIKWIDQEVQQKISKLRKLKIKQVGKITSRHDFSISLIISVIKTNPLLVSLKLPEEVKDDVSILSEMNKSYTLLETNSYVDPKILKRNKKLYDLTKRLTISFLASRNKHFKRFDKNLWEKIAKLIFEFRHDQEHLKALV